MLRDMKKLHEYQRLFQIRRAKTELRRRVGKKERLEAKLDDAHRRSIAFENSCRGVPPIQTLPGYWTPPSGKPEACEKLPAPEDFRYRTNPDGVVRFVYSLRREAVLRNRMVSLKSSKSATLYIDLDNIKDIDLDGALILAAELDRVSRHMGIRPYVDDANWSPRIRAFLYEFGFYRIVDARRVSDAVHIPKIGDHLAAEGLVVVKFITGNQADGRQAFALQNALIAEAPTVADSRLDFYEGLLEAFTNAIEHAYHPEIPDDGLFKVRRWWAGGFVDNKEGRLYMAVYDQGVGIPATLPRKPFWSSIFSGTAFEWTDARVIAGGLDYGRTRTSQDGRGNGLWSMCQITHGFDEAEVRITSGRGEVAYETGKPLRLDDFPSRFPGTLVRWRVRLPVEGSPE